MVLEKNLRAKVAKDRFYIAGNSYGHSTVMIPVRNQGHTPVEIHRFLKKWPKNAT